jgi:hypothetical protein
MASGDHYIVMRTPPVNPLQPSIRSVARVSLTFFFIAVPVGAVIWDYYGFLVWLMVYTFFLEDILDEWYF